MTQEKGEKLEMANPQDTYMHTPSVTVIRSHDVSSVQFIPLCDVLLLFCKTGKLLPIQQKYFPRCSHVADRQHKAIIPQSKKNFDKMKESSSCAGAWNSRVTIHFPPHFQQLLNGSWTLPKLMIEKH